ncbi:MAG: 1-deoxy-D-xylulose-5-phosphate reductoisomerase [PVC group bacterium]|nr:1-deoxy-D-xylulose-5-phosphate reductoisomerase [PVC group bacterium]
MKKISILGATGSIGTNTLDVISKRPVDFRVIGLSAYSNMRLLAKQIKLFKPKLVSVKDQDSIRELEKLTDLSGIRVYTQEQGLSKIATHRETEILVVATSGTISLVPTLLAIEQGKTIALANKEPLVMAGKIVMERLRKSKGKIIPVDSEHSAVFQCLQNSDINTVKNIYLTGSGGPFREFSKQKLKTVSLEMALKHPKWKMGRKITIDSATLMNKGLEIIEARWLFDIAPEKIKVVVHPEAIIHSMVEFYDGSVLSQMGVTDMRLPIQYALDYPNRRPNHLKAVDFFALKKLTFFKPDENKFPCLKIAKKIAAESGTGGCVMNAANEVAVNAFLTGKIGFMSISKIIESVLKRHKRMKSPTLDQIFECDDWARREARLLCYQQ